jgi:uncharacterized protein YjbI with pentapeptide repeats
MDQPWDPNTSKELVRNRPNWYALVAWTNTLDLQGDDLIDGAKLANIEKNESSTSAQRHVATLTLAGRDLTGANLSFADVRHVDFTGAVLSRANFSFAWAEKAQFNGAQLQGVRFVATQLQSAWFLGARLQSAFLNDAQLQERDAQIRPASKGLAQWRAAPGALLDHAQLQGASLYGAQLQDASLDDARLQGAKLGELHGGLNLVGAQLQGASLNFAHLQGAWLNTTQLQGASFKNANLVGSTLKQAQLQGADLVGADLRGASLDYAQLQGAWLAGAGLEAASLPNACVWRADTHDAGWRDTRVIAPVTRAKDGRMDQYCNWAADNFEKLKQLITEQVSEGNKRRETMKWIEQMLDPNKVVEGEEEIAKAWADHERSSPASEIYETSLEDEWRKTGCDADGAPYVVGSLISRLAEDHTWTSPFAENSPEVPKLAAAFLDKDCAGAHGLSDDDIAKLKEIAARAAPQAPKP